MDVCTLISVNSSLDENLLSKNDEWLKKDDQHCKQAPRERNDTMHKKHVSAVPILDYESLDYDRCDNVPYKKWLDVYSKKTYFHIALMKWILVAVIGILTGLTAFLINIGVHYLSLLKFSQFHKVYELVQHSGTIFLCLLVLLGFNVVYSIIASVLVLIEPIAAGSGIPEIKCYLNGIKMPRVVRIRTLLAKACGVLFSVAGGLLVGKEGPMIHSGAIIGSGIPQLRSFLWKKLKLPYSYFRSDKDKRDFVSCGAAAGVAAAFGAPIGGVLFSLEEGSSFWDQALTWRALFCAMCSTLTLNILLTVSPIVPGNDIRFGELDRPGLINFGRFTRPETEHLWTLQYIFVFAAMGAIGGLMGAWFNSLNKHLTIYRMNYVLKKPVIFKLLETVLIATVTTFSVFILATLLGTCVPAVETLGYQEFVDSTQNYFCPVKNLTTHIGSFHFTEYFNDMATLVFNSEEEAIKQLFHQDGAFTLPTLGISLIIYFFIACWTYGASIPSGLFVPCLTIGALYGRFVVTSLTMMGLFPPIYPGTFALIGAASFLGGVVRMTVSLTVILIESTGQIEYGLPLLVVLMVAKWVGDLFNEGIYDIHIELKEIPLLGWDSPDKMERLNAADVMNGDLKYVYPISRVGSIEQLLRTTVHNAFFVVTPMTFEPTEELVAGQPNIVNSNETVKKPRLYDRKSVRPIHRSTVIARKRQKDAMKLQGLESSETSSVSSNGGGKDTPLIFNGIILRSQLVTLLKNKIFVHNEELTYQPDISHLQLTADYPRYDTIFDVKLNDIEKNALMDISLYMNPCPYIVFHHTPLPRVFNIFRTMGLRHLPVLEDAGIVVGMITRHDLTHEHLNGVLYEKNKKKPEGQKTPPCVIANIELDDIVASNVQN